MTSITDLRDAEYSVFTAFGEDGILDFLCAQVGIEHPSILDFGAGDISESNGRWILTLLGGSGVFVDARNDLEETLWSSGLPVTARVTSLQRFIDFENAHSLYEESREILGGKIDIFSLDVDGQDYWILDAIQTLDAKIVLLEFQAYLGASSCISVPRDLTFARTQSHYSWLYYGASLPSFIHLLTQRGYIFVGTNRQRLNGFFVREDLISADLQRILDHMHPLAHYVDGWINESRDERGELTCLHGSKRLQLVEDLPFTDTGTGETHPLKRFIATSP